MSQDPQDTEPATTERSVARTRAGGAGKPGRRVLVAGNWKMHHDHVQAIRTVQDIGMRLAPGILEALDVSVHPPFTDLRSVQAALADRGLPLLLGAQNCHWEDQGAFTGEVSAGMLAHLGVAYVIVGHSERRRLFAETDEQVAKKSAAVLAQGMTPIVCVGETEEEHDSGLAGERIASQIRGSVGPLGPELAARVVVAYEPIWAIGTGRAASGADASAGCLAAREALQETSGDLVGEGVRVLYGGSVTPANAGELVAQADVDGLLVGGASLDGASFAGIVEAVMDARRLRVPTPGRRAR